MAIAISVVPWRYATLFDQNEFSDNRELDAKVAAEIKDESRHHEVDAWSRLNRQREKDMRLKREFAEVT